MPLFIGEHTNIDELLGDTGALCPSPVFSRIRERERIDEGERRTNLTRFAIDRVRVRGYTVRCTNYRPYPARSVSGLERFGAGPVNERTVSL